MTGIERFKRTIITNMLFSLLFAVYMVNSLPVLTDIPWPVFCIEDNFHFLQACQNPLLFYKMSYFYGSFLMFFILLCSYGMIFNTIYDVRALNQKRKKVVNRRMRK